MNHFQLGLHVVSCCPTSHVVSCWLPFQNLFSFPCHSQSIFQLAQILMQNITPLTPTKGISVFGSSYFLPQKKQAFRSEALHSPTTSLDEQKYSASDCCVEDSWKHRNCLFLKYCECTTAKLSTWIYSKWAGTQVPTRKIQFKPPHWENKPQQCLPRQRASFSFSGKFSQCTCLICFCENNNTSPVIHLKLLPCRWSYQIISCVIFWTM